MTAAETLRLIADRAQPLHTPRVVAFDEGDYCLDAWGADLGGEARIVIVPRACPSLCFAQQAQQVIAAGAGEGHRSVKVVEGIVAVRCHRCPAIGHARPAFADIHATTLQPPDRTSTPLN